MLFDTCRKQTCTSSPGTTNTVAPAPAASAPAGDNVAAPAGAAGKQNFTILNKTGHTVVSFNVSPTSEDDWGDDILGKDVLNNGESAEITFERDASACLWDLKATYDDNDTTEMKKQNLCEISEVTLTP
ncbi:MAG: hypothetical protein EOP61_16480 [Sphingomonadales bacterium]|nr:MAG: hypothetical protein EOP61_16480 [Sphingomonadales bacterium]